MGEMRRKRTSHRGKWRPLLGATGPPTQRDLHVAMVTEHGRLGWQAALERFHICGRLRERKRNLRDCIARSRVLTSVRPLLRPLIRRGPVWEFADRVHITATRSRRSVKNWFPDPVSLTVRHTFLSTFLRLR